MSKKEKIKKTLDFFGYCISICFSVPCLILGLAMSIAFSGNIIDMIYSILVLIISLILLYFGSTRLYKLLTKFYNYTFVTVTRENFRLEPLLWFRYRRAKVIITIDGRDYVSRRIVSARNYALAERLNKLEVGVNWETCEIVVVDPKYTMDEIE